jgi:hypothetical protein
MKINRIHILLLFLLFAGLIHAQVSEYEYKAAFLERFTRFVKWPDESINNQSDSTFRIAVIGVNPFNSILDNLFADIKIKNQNAEVFYTNNINDLTRADMIFISGSEKRRIREIISAIGRKPILIISDSKGFCEMGAHINMYIEGNSLRYEINQKALEESGLKVSSLLLASAKIVKADE